MNRDASIEFFRCLLMFAITAIHVASAIGGQWKFVSNALCPCVVAFVFISGYYGVKFSPRKVFRLCGLGVWCAIIAAVLSMTLLGSEKGLYAEGFHNYQCYWFLHAYVFMMFFAPVIDAALTQENALRLGLPILFLVFIWSFAYSFRMARSFVVGQLGFGEFSGVTLIGIYVSARIYRLKGLERIFTVRMSLLVLLVTLPLTAVRFGAYDSPVALLVAACMFSLAKKISVRREWLNALVCLLTPSLFSIYLLQVNGFAWKMYPKMIERFGAQGMKSLLVFLLGTLTVFTGGLSIDLVRRFICRKLVFVSNPQNQRLV